MKEMFNVIITDEEGQGMVEYGLIIAGIAVAVMGAIWVLGPKISALFTEVDTKITGV